MKTKMYIPETSKRIQKFPLLAKRKNDPKSEIFLFTDEYDKIILCTPHKDELSQDFMVGHTSTSTKGVFDSSIWEIIPKITITFES